MNTGTETDDVLLGRTLGIGRVTSDRREALLIIYSAFAKTRGAMIPTPLVGKQAGKQLLPLSKQESSF